MRWCRNRGRGSGSLAERHHWPRGGQRRYNAGTSRHGEPTLRRHRIPSVNCRLLHFGGRPDRRANNGSSTAHDAKRPELFFKSVAWRVVTDGDPIGIRGDSDLNVPEAELAVVANAAGEIVGTVANDVSSRSIEGEHPLYLPQAKVYAVACAFAPGVRPAWEVGQPGGVGVRHGGSFSRSEPT